MSTTLLLMRIIASCGDTKKSNARDGWLTARSRISYRLWMISTLSRYVGVDCRPTRAVQRAPPMRQHHLLDDREAWHGGAA